MALGANRKNLFGSVSLLVALASAQPAIAAPEILETPTREVTLTLSEGTWMSTDVSPDGQTIVFDLLNDI